MPSQDDEDEIAIPRTISDGGAPRRTGQHRSITPTDAEEIARASARRQAAAERDERQRQMELHFAEWFGADGDGGRIVAMEGTVMKHDGQLAVQGETLRSLVEFKARLLWIAGLAITIGGVIAGLAFRLVEYLTK